MSDFDLVVTGRVVLTDRVLDDGYVAIRGGIVERVATARRRRRRRDRISAAATSCLARSTPRCIRNRNSTRRISSGRARAAAGGVTTIVDIAL